jgi:hypothetical protein
VEMNIGAVLRALLYWVIWLCICGKYDQVGAKNGRQISRQLRYEQAQPSRKVPMNFVYVVGVEGVGHHGVTPALSVIAKSCGQLVGYEPLPLRTAHRHANAEQYSTTLARWGLGGHKGARGVTIIEDQSFPTDGVLRNSSLQAKKGTNEYNIEWLYNRVREANTNVRFFHLTRDFYRTASSHVEFDGGFQRHAVVLKNFLDHIKSEYELIEKRQQGLWRQIHYEWFTEMRNCPALVYAIIDFVGWNQCDVDFACKVLHRTLRNSTKRGVNEADYAFAQSLNASIPIPDLDISDNRVYHFGRVVSARRWDLYDAELRISHGEHPFSVFRTHWPRNGTSYNESDAADVVYTSTVGAKARAPHPQQHRGAHSSSPGRIRSRIPGQR